MLNRGGKFATDPIKCDAQYKNGTSRLARPPGCRPGDARRVSSSIERPTRGRPRPLYSIAVLARPHNAGLGELSQLEAGLEVHRLEPGQADRDAFAGAGSERRQA